MEAFSRGGRHIGQHFLIQSVLDKLTCAHIILVAAILCMHAKQPEETEQMLCLNTRTVHKLSKMQFLHRVLMNFLVYIAVVVMSISQH